MSSRPAQALNWSQAGGSLKADSAGVVGSMPFENELNIFHLSKIKKLLNQGGINFGDRKNEIVLLVKIWIKIKFYQNQSLSAV